MKETASAETRNFHPYSLMVSGAGELVSEELQEGEVVEEDPADLNRDTGTEHSMMPGSSYCLDSLL